MDADLGNLGCSRLSPPPAAMSPHVCTSACGEPAVRPAILSRRALRGFSDGFVGGLIGGGVCCLVLVWFQTDELVLVYLRVVALSLVFGGFEMWRVTHGRTLKSARKNLGWTLLASVLLLWGLGMAVRKAERSHPAPPHEKPGPLAPSPGQPHLTSRSGGPCKAGFRLLLAHYLNSSKQVPVTTSGAFGARENST